MEKNNFDNFDILEKLETLDLSEEKINESPVENDFDNFFAYEEKKIKEEPIKIEKKKSSIIS
jgi:hypothetical protein